MKFQNTVLTLFTVLYSFSLFANLQTDSLLLELKNTQKNKDKILLINELSRTFINTNLDSSIYYAKQGLNLASEIAYSHGIAENAASLGDYYVMCDSLNKAKLYYYKSRETFFELGIYFDYAQISMVIGNIYLSQNNYSDALLNYNISEEVCLENDFSKIIPHVYNNKGLVYNSHGDSEKALDYYKKAYDGFNRINQKESLANVVCNIADIHLHYSDNDSLAIDYYNEALNLFKEYGDQVGAANIYIVLGNNESIKGNHEKALDYYFEGLSLITSENIEFLGPKSRTYAMLYSRIGIVYSNIGDIPKAIYNLEKSLDLAIQNEYVRLIEENNYELSKIYELKKDYRKALEFYKVYEEVGDSILNESSIKKITKLEMQFEFDKEIKEIELENTRREAEQQKKEFLYLLFVGLGIFIAIIGFLLYANQRNKTSKVELKRQNLKLEHEKLQQELDHRNKELATNVMYLLSKNEFITTTAEKLTKAKMSFKKENQKIIQDVIRDLLMNSSKDVWKEFEVRFQQVHSGFYDNLNNSFPDLTPNEKKICAFLRLNMSTKDIAAITYQSVRSINMARFRLRKKIGLESDENLISYLSQM